MRVGIFPDLLANEFPLNGEFDLIHGGMIMFVLPPEANESTFTALLDYWWSKIVSSLLPSRGDIDPTERPSRILANLLLFGVESGPAGRRYRFRVAGTGFTRMAGSDPTGRCIGDRDPDERGGPIIEALAAVVTLARPVFLSGPPPLSSEDFLGAHRLYPPLAGDGRHVDMVLASFLAVPRGKDQIGVPERKSRMMVLEHA